MEPKLLKKIDFFVAGYGVIICVAAIIFGGTHMFVGTLVGSILALLNWIGFRWAGVRMAVSGEKTKFAIFLAVKTVLVLAAVAVILSTKVIDPMAFLFGLSALILGVFTKSAMQALSEGDAALRKEQ